jgi:hypothetical protein
MKLVLSLVLILTAGAAVAQTPAIPSATAPAVTTVAVNTPGAIRCAVQGNAGMVADSSNPALAGSTILQIFCTGVLSGNNAIVTIGGVAGSVLYSGAVGSNGGWQVNASVPASAPGGSSVPVVVEFDEASSDATTIAVQSFAASGSLQIQITGLPAGTVGKVHINSSFGNGFESTITSDQIFDLPPGSYTVRADSITMDGGYRRGAFPSEQVVTVAQGANTVAAVPYTAVVKPNVVALDNADASTLSIADGGNTMVLLASGPTAQLLAAGRVLVVGVTDATPEGRLVKVLTITPQGDRLMLSVVPAAFTDIFSEIDFRHSETIGFGKLRKVQLLRDGVTVSPGLSNRRALSFAAAATSQGACPAGQDLFVATLNTNLIQDPNGSVNVNGYVNVCLTFNFAFSYSTIPPRLNTLTATATLAETAHINATGVYHNSYNRQVALATVTTSPIVIVVAGLPITLSPQATFFLGSNGQVNGGFSVGLTQTASFTGGVAYNYGNVSPIFITNSSFGPDPMSLDAALTVKGYAGVTLAVKVAGVVTPSFSPDAWMQLHSDIHANPWWAVTGGLEGSASIDFNVLGIDLWHWTSGNLFPYQRTIAQASGGFFTSSAAPVLGSISPTSTRAGTGALTISAFGNNYVPDSVITFNGLALATSFVSTTQLTAVVPANSVSSAGNFAVAVSNPDTAGAKSSSQTFTVQAVLPVLSSIAVTPATITGPSASLTVTLSGPAPAGGSSVGVASTSSVLSVPSSVTVPAGQTAISIGFPVKTVTAATSPTVTATYNGSSKSTTVTVKPPPVFVSCVANPSSILLGQTTTISAQSSGGVGPFYFTVNGIAGSTLSVRPSARGVYTASVTVRDSAGQTASASCSAQVR